MRVKDFVREREGNLPDLEIAFWLPGKMLLLHELLSPQQRNGKELKFHRFPFPSLSYLLGYTVYEIPT